MRKVLSRIFKSNLELGSSEYLLFIGNYIAKVVFA